MMDLGSGERGALDELDGYQTNKANLTIVLMKLRVYRLDFWLVLRLLLPASFIGG
jgi:hypothetical protein